MLDYFCVFTRGGALLWALSVAPLIDNPVSALVRECLLEERTADTEWTLPASRPGGTAYTLKWSLNNSLGLVFVAVYQAALKLTYVDDLLTRVNRSFSTVFVAGTYDYPQFDATFKRLSEAAEARAGGVSVTSTAAVSSGRGSAPAGSGAAKGSGGRRGGASGAADGGAADEDDDGDDDGDDGAAGAAGPPGSGFDRSALARLKARGKKAVPRGGGSGGGSGGGGGAAPKTAEASEEKAKAKRKAKSARVWDDGKVSAARAAELDFTEGSPPEAGAAALAEDFTAPSRLDAAGRDGSESDGGDDSSYATSDESDFDESGNAVQRARPEPAKRGLLSSLARSITTAVGGTSALTAADVAPALDALTKRLVERNVAEPIARRVAASVEASLVGRPVRSLSGGVRGAVRRAIEAALTRVLTPRASVDVLAAARAARASRGPDDPPYTIVFVGVNGVGKSTNLSKVAYWLKSNGLGVMLAACDTFRAGAVEQLQTHAVRLGVPLYQRGYEKDPARVASEAQRAARAAGADVLLVDTAGRMQDNEPLMRALAGLLKATDPDLVLFVGEALAGNDAVDQLGTFSRRLGELLPPPRASAPVDGILLTKFDTVSEKVGAALSLVYSSGAPIIFVGCGQTYVDLKRLDVKSVVKPLLA